MKYALIADVHGNFHALQAVLADARQQGADSYLFLGDYIFDMPFSNEVIQLIRNTENKYVIKGNKEGYLENGIPFPNTEQFGAIHQTYKELKKENLDYLLGLEEVSYIGLPYSGRLYMAHFIDYMKFKPKKTETSAAKFREAMEKAPFTHAQFLEQVHRLLDSTETINALNCIDAEVILFGHIHLQWYGYSGNKLVVNPGSCGQPLDYDPRAAYTILEDTKKGIIVHEKRVPYDIEKAIEEAKKTEVFRQGRIWCSTVFDALRTAKDPFGQLFHTANKIALEKNEEAHRYSNETWQEAYEAYLKN